MKSLGRFSIGVGDRFAHQAPAQLRACIQAAEAGTVVAPVWNKSNREHTIIGSEPAETRAAADAAVRRLGWKQPYFCDADHINLRTVDRFLEPCDFFTIDVADQIGMAAAQAELDAFVRRHAGLIGQDGTARHCRASVDHAWRPGAGGTELSGGGAGGGEDLSLHRGGEGARARS